ncbi:MAG: translation initiation factor IF-2 [Deltaproteobacteria bacterium]|nr:translation initiation factor IF-2 [Deltaproteobacteria bacterium]
MAKKRVHEVAKDLGLSNQDALEKLKKLGFDVKSHSSTIDEEELKRKMRDVEPAPKVSKTVIRRRAGGGESEPARPEPRAPEPIKIEARARVEEVEARVEAPKPELPKAPEAPKAPEPRIEPAPEPELTKPEVLTAEAPEPSTVVAEPPQAEAKDETAPPVEAAPSIEVAPATEPKVEEPPPEPPKVEVAPATQPSDRDEDSEDRAESKKERREARSARPDRKREEDYDEEDEKPELEDLGISLSDFVVPEGERRDAKVERVAPPPPSGKPAQLKKEEEPKSTIVRTIDPSVLKARLNQSKRPEPPKEWGKPEAPPMAASPVTELVVRTDASGKRKELVDVRKEAAKGKTGKAGQRRREEMSARDLLEHKRGQVFYPSPSRKRVKTGKKSPRRQETPLSTSKRAVEIGEMITVADLAKQMGKKATEVIAFLMREGIMASINQPITNDVASLVANEFGYEVESLVFEEEDLLEGEEAVSTDPDAILRAPVVTVMGHVDHGKTTLLDRIRKTNVAAGEAGGITQRIAGYQVNSSKGLITFLDTPGHAAFTAMRARGANVTDIVILVVAADDGVMPQTVEAISLAKAAEVPLIVAMNKIDKPEANPDRVLQQLSTHGVVVEEWGGDVLCRKISAKTGEGMDELLDLLALQAEILELRANPNVPARGTVVEAQIDKGRGPVATVLVQEGTLRIGDIVVVGESIGRVRALLSDGGKRIKEALPSMPVQILGLDVAPQPGDELRVASDMEAARKVVSHRTEKRRAGENVPAQRVSLQDLFTRMKEGGGPKELKVLIKADVQGSVEAIRESLVALSNDQVKVTVIHGGVGAVVESDIEFAKASDAIVMGFAVRPDTNAVKAARSLGVEIRTHEIIYEIVDEVRLAMEGLLSPVTEERYLGRAEIRQTFSVPKVGTIAGCAVVDGIIQRSAQIRVIRNGKSVFTGKLASLRRFKDDVREVKEGFECGMSVDRFNDIAIGDIIEAFELTEVKQQLKDPAKEPGRGPGKSEARP